MFIFCWDNYLLLKTAFSLKLKYWVTSHSDSLGISLRGTHFLPWTRTENKFWPVVCICFHCTRLVMRLHALCALSREYISLEEEVGVLASPALALFSPRAVFPNYTSLSSAPLHVWAHQLSSPVPAWLHHQRKQDLTPRQSF